MKARPVELFYDNKACMFCLQYICGWAYFPFHYPGEKYQALNYIMIAVPVGVHMLGYYLGKLKQQKIQETLEETNGGKRRKK